MLGFIFNRFRKRSYFVSFTYSSSNINAITYASVYVSGCSYVLKEDDLKALEQRLIEIKNCDFITITFIYPL